MRIFVDTSTLFKKYVEEAGSQRFEKILGKATQLIVSPLTRMETHSVIARRLKEKMLTPKEAETIIAEMRIDFDYFARVRWDEQLEEQSVQLIRRYQLKTLDGIQLAAAVLSAADLVITSDKRLFLAAKKAVKKVLCI